MASPSKNQNYAYLSRLSTQKLLELLAAAPAPAETPEDKAYIDAIVEVVLEREERHPTGLLPDPEQAWEEFQQYYNTPEGSRSQGATRSRQSTKGIRWWMGDIEGLASVVKIQ